MNTQTGIDYIINGKRKYPEWLKNHQVFKDMNKIDKVFPKIGLPNFREPCEIMNTAEAKTSAIYLGNRIKSEMSSAKTRLFSSLEVALKSTEKNRNEVCCSIQSMISLIDTLCYSFNLNDYVKVEDGKVVMRLRSDLFNGNKNPVFRKDEAVLRVAGKIWAELDTLGVKLTKLDQYQEFKDFSRVNLPNKKYTVCFSSSGEDGAWDIGTISMRGITSCQGWSAPQSRGLIGSISSRYVGVIYISSDKDEVPGYGSKMLNRCMVRFAIHKKTKKPILMLDNMYPNANNDTLATFKKVLSDKSGLEVRSTSEGALTEYYVPDESSRKLLKQGEASYADYPIEVKEHASSIKVIPANIKSLMEDFKKKVCIDLDNMIKVKRELYLAEEKRVEELKAIYLVAKAKWQTESQYVNTWEPDGSDTMPKAPAPFDLVEPKIDDELRAFGGGGIMNLLNHLDKRHGKGLAGTTFAKLFLNSIIVSEEMEYVSKEEYHRKYLMSFLKNTKSVKEEAHKKFVMGTWMKSFPKSGEKFFEMIYGQMKGYFLADCKEMIKKSN
jgi:hypothetical protein